jgi:rhodanese-related sulfurtransferase
MVRTFVEVVGNSRGGREVCTYILPPPLSSGVNPVRPSAHDQAVTVPFELPARDALRLSHEGATVLDVRETFEVAGGHIPGAVNLPLSVLGTRADELGDGPIVVVCRSGNRSAHAVRYLRQLGYDASNLTGGMVAWQQEGLPTEVPATGRAA